jgi:hypothetical protein
LEVQSNKELFSVSMTPTFPGTVLTSIANDTFIVLEFSRSNAVEIMIQIRYSSNNDIENVGDSVRAIFKPSMPINANVSCPRNALPGSVVRCGVNLIDLFGNPSGDSIGSLLTNFTVSTHSVVNVKYKDIGSFEVSFRTPKEEGDVVLHTPYNNKDLVVHVVSSQVKSASVYCPSTVVAGSLLRCIVNTKNASELPFGGIVESNAIEIKISSTFDAPNDNDIQYNAIVARNTFEGEHSAELTLSKSGEYNVQVSLLSIKLPSVNVTVASSTIDASRSSVSCPATAVVQERLVCSVFARDAYENLVGANASTSAVEQKLVIDGKAVHLGTPLYISTGTFQVYFAPNATGEATVTTKFGNLDVGKTVTVTVLPDAPRTIQLSCPNTAVANSTVTCEMIVKDTHGNLIRNRSLIPQSSVHLSSLAPVQPIKYTGIAGFFEVSFRVPTHDTTLTVTSSLNEMQQNLIQIVSSSISASRSTGTCLRTIAAGNVFSCVVNTYSAYKSLAKVGEAEARAFSLSVVLKSARVTHASYTSTGTYMNNTGSFKLEQLITVAGEYEITLSFAGRHISVNKSLTVMPGSISKQAITLNCPSERSNTCEILMYDMYNNLVGSEIETPRLTSIVYDENSGRPGSATIQYAQTTGKYSLQFFARERRGILVLFYLGEIIATRVVNSHMPLLNASIDATTEVSTIVATTTLTPARIVNETSNSSGSNTGQCISAHLIYAECVAARGKWAFTCNHTSWKRGSICNDSKKAFFNRTCVSVCA